MQLAQTGWVGCIVGREFHKPLILVLVGKRYMGGGERGGWGGGDVYLHRHGHSNGGVNRQEGSSVGANLLNGQFYAVPLEITLPCCL